MIMRATNALCLRRVGGPGVSARAGGAGGAAGGAAGGVGAGGAGRVRVIPSPVSSVILRATSSSMNSIIASGSVILSRREQEAMKKAEGGDGEDVAEKLRVLNEKYEETFPGLRYVYVSSSHAIPVSTGSVVQAWRLVV